MTPPRAPCGPPSAEALRQARRLSKYGIFATHFDGHDERSIDPLPSSTKSPAQEAIFDLLSDGNPAPQAGGRSGRFDLLRKTAELIGACDFFNDECPT